LLKIKDGQGKLKFVLRDEDEEPVSIDELILKDSKKKEKPEEKENG
jgi:hypothetical protein